MEFMKNIFQKAISCLLTISLLNVPAFAEEDAEKALLYTAPFVSAEQVSYTCGKLFDDFEKDVTLWQASDGVTLEKAAHAVCGEGCMNLISDGPAEIMLPLDDENLTPYSGIMATFGNFSDTGIDISITVTSGDNELTAYGTITPGGYYTASLDIREMKGKKSADGIKITASHGGFCVDYVNASTTYAPCGAIPNFTREYEISGAEAEISSSGAVVLDCNKKDVTVSTDRLGCLLKDGENAVSITVNNDTNAEDVTFAYTDKYGSFTKSHTHTQTLKEGLCTYTFPLDGIDALEQFRLTFSSKPEGTIALYGISFTYFEEEKKIKGKCTTDGENITVSYEDLNVPEGYPVYLYRMLPGESDISLPYKANLDGEKSFTFPIIDGKENNLLYKYKVMYDKEGELETVCEELTVENPENCADGGAFITPATKKGVYGEYAEFAGSVFLEIDVSAAVSEERTQYAYTFGENEVFINGDTVEYLDKRVSGINETGGAVYIVISAPSSNAEFFDEKFVTVYSSVISFISKRYNGSENGTVNGFVVGKGLNESGLGMKDALECAELSLKTAYIAARRENSLGRIMLSLDADGKIAAHKFMLSLLVRCPYVSDMVAFVSVKDDESYYKTPGLLKTLAEAGLQREFSIYAVFGGYKDDAKRILRDFYSLCESSVECIAISFSDAVKNGKVFKYMDTSDRNKYTDEYCEGFDFDSWDELCSDDVFLSNILKIKPAYTSYGEIDGGKMLFFTESVEGWKKGVGCTALSSDGNALFASFDTNGTGMGFVTVNLPEGTELKNNTVSVKVKADYLQSGTKSVEVFVYAVSANAKTCAIADVKADTETVISFDPSFDAEKLIIGIKGTGTPRLCIYEGAVSSFAADEETKNEESTPTSDGYGERPSNNGTVFKTVLIVAVIGIISCAAVFVVKKRKENKPSF